MSAHLRPRRRSVVRSAVALVGLFVCIAFVLGQVTSVENESPKEAVTAFKAWRQATPQEEHDEAEHRTWRDRLVRSAEADLNDAWAAMALYSAADLSNLLGEPDRARELYETIISDTTGDDTYRIFAHQALIHKAEMACRSKPVAERTREDLVRVFEAYDRCADAIRQLGPERRGRGIHATLDFIPLGKARFLLSLQKLPNTDVVKNLAGPPIEQPPPCDPTTGLAPSSLIEDWIRAAKGGALVTAGPREVANAYRTLARAYMAEGKNGEGYRVFQGLLELLDSSGDYSAPQVAEWACEALDPTRGAQFRYHAEQFERRFADHPDRPRLTYAIAGSYLADGVPQAFIDRMAPVLESSRPEDVAWLELPDVRASILNQLADAYEHPSVGELDKAAASLKEILDEHPDARFVNDYLRSRYASLAARVAGERQTPPRSVISGESKRSE